VGPAGLHRTLTRLGLRLHRLDDLARRFDTLLGCTTRVGVDRAGDRQHRWGFWYDERDGTGLDLRPALVTHRGRGEGRWDLLRLDTRRRCLSAPADPNGAGDDARPAARTGVRSHGQLQGLRRHLRRVERLADRVDARTERFDAWESCLSWLPVTEAGDADQDLGYVTGAAGTSAGTGHRPAVDLDHSEWDDPDYQLLAFRGTDRPFGPGECGSDPGEAADRSTVAARRHRPHRDGGLADLRRDVRDLREDVEDLGEPVDDITRFDQCLYTAGVASRPGYVYRDRSGVEGRRPALSFDMRGHLPAMSVMAFPGEEPPQIECNEDAGGVETDE
jgi:hypothetical protein